MPIPRAFLSLVASLLLSACAVHNPAMLATPRLSPSAPLELEQERLFLDCNEPDARGMRCAFSLRTTLFNTSQDPLDVELLLHGARLEHLEIEGSSLRTHTPPKASRIAPHEPMRRWFDDPDIDLSQHTTLLTLPPGRHHVVVRGAIRAGVHEKVDLFAFRTAMQVRHTAALPQEPWPTVYQIDLLPSPADLHGPDYRLDLTVEHPERWGFEAFAAAGHDPLEKASGEHDSERWTPHTEGRRTTQRFALDPLGTPDSGYVTHYTLDAPDFEAGGPVVAAGLVFEEELRFVGRIGYEFAFPGYLIHSVLIESDAQQRFTPVLQTEFALPSVFYFPSLAIGAGFPLQILPELQPGIRLSLSAHLPYFGLVFALDLFPGRDAIASPRLLGQLSF